MVKLYSKMKIIRHTKDGVEEVIPKRTVFDGTPAEAKQFDALNSARPATAEEIKDDKERRDLDEGLTSQNPAPSDAVLAGPEETVAMPDSGAYGDPNSAPKGKTR